MTTEEEINSVPQEPQFINLNIHKAGLDGLDQGRINQIIQEASKGSNFYSFQQKRQKRIDSQIKELQSRSKKISELEKQLATKKADVLLSELEQHRILNKIIVHFDMDMFYAAVEIKKNPNLANYPMAVGSMAMISTSNYLARRFGVRSAMAGFIAKKLCPQLIMIKPNFKHYAKESEFVMNIISEYDPNLRTCSLDEVYIDLTDYVFSKYSFENNFTIEELSALNILNDDIWNFAFKIVDGIRKRIFDETKLTVSAGISCNTLLAKICTDINKPNGQFMIKGNRDEITNFVSKTELRKFTGIGPVRGQILEAFNIIKACDIYNERSLLVNLFSELNVIYYLKIYLGIGTSHLHEDETFQKSHSREVTIGDISDFNGICVLLQDLSRRLSKDLKRENQKCRTITLKLKKISFEVFIKSRTIDQFTDDEQTIFNVSRELLSQELNKSPQNHYRLIGLKASNLCNQYDNSRVESSNQSTLSQFFKQNGNRMNQFEQNDIERNHRIINYECVLCDQTFDDVSNYEMHKYFCNGDLFLNNFDEEDEKEAINEDCSEPTSSVTKDITKNDISYAKDEWQYLKCPICQSNTLFNNNDDLNRHIDICLNRELCIELTTVSPNFDSSLELNPTSIIKRNCLSDDNLKKSNKKKNNRKVSSLKSTNAKQMKIDHFFY